MNLGASWGRALLTVLAGVAVDRAFGLPIGSTTAAGWKASKARREKRESVAGPKARGRKGCKVKGASNGDYCG